LAGACAGFFHPHPNMEAHMEKFVPVRGLALACVLMAGGTAALAQDGSTVAKAVAQKQASEVKGGGPARWDSEDTTRQGRLRTLHKEIGAAYEEAKQACRAGPAPARGPCLQGARQNWQQDMKDAPAQLDAAPAGQVTTRVETSVSTR
jgi:hypothetical protein